MNKIRLISGLGISILLGSCASYMDSIRGLEAIHREPVGQGAPAVPQTVQYLEYNAGVEEDGELDEVTDPVAFCLDAIQVIAEHACRTEMERAASVYILCKTGHRSPAKLVRASAIRALVRIFQAPPTDYHPPGERADPAECVAWLERIRQYTAAGEGDRTRGEGINRAYVALIDLFGNVRYDRAETAWKVLDTLILRYGYREKDPEAGAAYEKTAWALNRQAFFLVATEAMRDPNDTVREEALKAVFLFPWSEIRASLDDVLEEGQYWNTPRLCIQILEYLKTVSECPEDLGMKILGQVAVFLDFSHSGVVHQAVAVFQHITGMEQDSPNYWRDWWREYLLKHAGEEEP